MTSLAFLFALAVSQVVMAADADSAETTRKKGPLPTADQAEREALLLHETLHNTLHMVHHHFYKEDESLPIPAATLKDVFEQIEKSQQVQLRWLVVEGQAMNADHIARNDFEKEAVRKLKEGKTEHVQVEGNVYRRAAGIILTNECLKCHVPDRKSIDNRTAGLIISIPIQPR